MHVGSLLPCCQGERTRQKLCAHFTKLCLVGFCKFLDDFWGGLERDSFPQRLSKIGRNIKYLM